MMDYAIVFLLGVACVIVPSALVVAARQRPTPAPIAPREPPAPLLVLPPAQHTTYNYYDNRSVTIQAPPRPVQLQRTTNGPPLLPQSQPPRRFRVVGEREEWPE